LSLGSDKKGLYVSSLKCLAVDDACSGHIWWKAKTGSFWSMAMKIRRVFQRFQDQASVTCGIGGEGLGCRERNDD
jgi:hypothetical protein